MQSKAGKRNSLLKCSVLLAACAAQALCAAEPSAPPAALPNSAGGDRILLVKRRPTAGMRSEAGLEIGLPSNHECNASLKRTGYDNEICILEPDGRLRTLYRPPDGGYVGEVDLHWDGDRLLFTKSDATNWKVFEIHTDGTGLRQVSQLPDDVDCFDACYLPNGKIVFGSTASFQSVPCWHGQKRVSNLYLMNADGSGVRQLCFDQDHDFHATVLPNGQVLYHRWDYTGINHIFLRQLMVMNPDGTGQRAIYGSNSWYPNALYFPRPLPGSSQRIVSILSGYHGVHRMGQLVLLDTARGWHEAEGFTQRISGRGDPLRPLIKDNLVDDDWPKFLHPFPLSATEFLVSMWPRPGANWALYRADTSDQLTLLREEPGWALLEPVPLKKSTRPPVIPDRVDLQRRDGSVYLHDVYAGPGLAGVPRGTIKSLRVLSYHFGYRGLAGPDKIGLGGPWEVMRILGTVPLEADGSALFHVPANTPVAVQPLDAEGKAVQLMRSWFTVMPGETTSCIGCHESPADVPSPAPALAARQPVRDLTPWRGPARGFDFAREVQPVLDAWCVRCHGSTQLTTGAGTQTHRPDLRAEVPGYRGHRVSQLEIDRLPPQVRADTQGVLQYTAAYEALLPYVRRVGIEDDVSLLTPGEYHADTSPLIRMLRQGHHGVALDAEAWDRLVTWIDLNAPCHGTWHEVYPIPDGAHERRMALRKAYGGPTEDPESIPAPAARCTAPQRVPREAQVAAPAQPAETKPTAATSQEVTLDLGGGSALRLVRVDGRVPFWIGVCEVSNAQFRKFDPHHDSRYYQKRYPAPLPGAPQHLGPNALPLTLNDDRQPAVRVSWEQATAFCRWLSARTGRRIALPTEAQWAGCAGRLGEDFSRDANFADAAFSKGLGPEGKQFTGGLEHLMLEGAKLADARYDDGHIVTAPTGSLRPNAWGLCDMFGNAAEWTSTPAGAGRYVVRGGSFFDPPQRAQARLDYPAWQRVFDVGFRVVMEDNALQSAAR